MNKRVAVIYMAHDGFTSLYTGVGTVARDFLLSFPEVADQLKGFRPDVDLSFYATTLKYKKGCFGYSEDVKQATVKMTNVHPNIHLVELINGSAGKESYGTIGNWHFASISGATFVHDLESQYDQLLVITVDTPFVQVANYYLDTYRSDKVQFIWMPQSTVKIHHYGKSADTQQQGNTYEDERFIWEKAVIDLANRHKQVKIGCVGDFMRNHLMDDYDARPDILVNVANSLYLQRLEGNKISQEKIADILNTLGVPLDRPLLFSFGRAEPYKGLDLVMRNADELISKHNYFVLILASPYSMDDPYLKELDAIAARHPEDIKIVYGLDFTTPHYIMQWKLTSILAILSRAEPFGLIPVEARYYNNPNLSLLVSDRDGLPYQVAQGQDGFIVKLDDQSIHEIYLRIAELPKEEKTTIATKGYERVCKEYNQVAVNTELLRNYLFNEEAFKAALGQLVNALNEQDITWCLGASGALFVQGVAVKPKDLDVIVDTNDLQAAYDLLKKSEPGSLQTLTFAGKSFQKFELEGMPYSTEVAGFDITSDPLTTVAWQGINVPVHPLDFELGMYRQRPGKERTVQLIEKAMERNAPNVRS